MSAARRTAHHVAVPLQPFSTYPSQLMYMRRGYLMRRATVSGLPLVCGSVLVGKDRYAVCSPCARYIPLHANARARTARSRPSPARKAVCACACV